MLDLILILIALAALSGIVFLGAKNKSTLARIDLKNLHKAQATTAKEEIIYRRLERKFVAGSQKLFSWFQPLSRWLVDLFRKIYRRVAHLERKYRVIAEEKEAAEPTNGSTALKLSGEIDELIEKDEYAEAEKRIIELISHAPNSPIWYRRLGDLYVKTKDYVHARETYEYVITLDEKLRSEKEIINGSESLELAGDYLTLGQILRDTGELDAAVEKIEKACRLEANNPRNLDLLIETSILAGNKVLAWEAFDRLKNVNPDNQKIAELEDRLNEIDKQSRIERQTSI